MAMNTIDINEADVFVLADSLKKIGSVCNSMNGSLNLIGTTTEKASKLFTPILRRNNQLSILQTNIESSLNSVASVKDLANDASKYELILEQQISNVGLKQYINAIHKIDDLLEDLNDRTKLNSTTEFGGMVLHLNELIRDGERNLQVYFGKLLNSIQPFDPQINMNKKIPFPYYDDDYLQQMSFILDYFENSVLNDEMVEIFIKQRINLISTSLGFLEPFAKQITYSPNAPYQKGSSGINSYTEALVGFVANESSLIQDLYSKDTDKQPLIFNKLTESILQSYLKIVDINIKVLEKDVENVGLFSFELSENLNKVARFLKGKNMQDLRELNFKLHKVQGVSQSLFTTLISYIHTKTHSMSQLPSDNGVTEATVDVMSKLRKFSEYKPGCLTTIENMTRSKWLPVDDKSYWTVDNSQLRDTSASSLLSVYFGDCIDYLLVGLEQRGLELLNSHNEHHLLLTKKLIHSQRIGFFVLNNLTLVHQIVQRSEINSILGDFGLNRLEKLKKRYLNYFISEWRDLTALLLDQVFVDSSGRISSKEKDQIKDKFKKFHDGFEDLVSRSKSYRISDPSLKKLLNKEIVSLVLPMYERFYNRYKDSFKHPRKHIKYTPSELMNILNSIIK